MPAVAAVCRLPPWWNGRHARLRTWWRKPCWFDPSRGHSATDGQLTRSVMSEQHRFVTIIHGFGMTPEKMWFPWMHRKLEAAGFGVHTPALPDPLTPTYRKWMAAMKSAVQRWDENTYVIGHSIGGVVVLRALEHLAAKPVRGVMLIGSPFAAFPGVKEMETGFAMPIDWARLKAMAGAYTVIHSKDDLLAPYDHALRYQEALGARLVTAEKDGHFIGKTAPLVWDEFSKMANGMVGKSEG